MITASESATPAVEAPKDARARIVRAAYELFSHHGIQAVGVQRVIAEAGVTRSTLYRHFRSKDELVLAALEHREELWTFGWLERLVVLNGRTPTEQLLAVFDAFDEWFRRDGYEGCFFTNSLLESRDPRSAVGSAAAMGLAGIHALVRRLAEEAGVRDPEAFAKQWQILMLGSIVVASTGGADAARYARTVAELMLEREKLDISAQTF